MRLSSTPEGAVPRCCPSSAAIFGALIHETYAAAEITCP